MTDLIKVALISTLVPLVGGGIGWMIKRLFNKLNHIIVLTNSTLTLANERIAFLEAAYKKLLDEKPKDEV